MAVRQNQGYHFGVGEFTTHFRTDFSGWIESDVHWGLTDLDFDPWPYGRYGAQLRGVPGSRFLTARTPKKSDSCVSQLGLWTDLKGTHPETMRRPELDTSRNSLFDNKSILHRQQVGCI